MFNHDVFKGFQKPAEFLAGKTKEDAEGDFKIDQQEWYEQYYGLVKSGDFKMENTLHL